MPKLPILSGKKVVKALKKASKAHAGQAKVLKGVINGGSKNRNR